MKKSLLISACAFTCMAAAAQLQPVSDKFESYKTDFRTFEINNGQERSGATRGTGTMEFSNAGDPSNCYSLKGVNLKSYLYIASELSVAEQAPFIGCSITAVTFYTPVNDNNVNPITKAGAFVMADKGTLPAFTNVTLSSEGLKKTRVELTTPVEITGEAPLVYGYRFAYSAQCYYLIVDENVTNANTCLAANTSKAADVPTFYNYADQIGSACISIEITGNLPDNVAVLKGVEFSPYYPQGTFSYDVSLKNAGGNSIENVSIMTQAGDVTVENTYTLPNFILPGAEGKFTVDNIQTPAPGIYNTKVSLTKVNGVALAAPLEATGTLTTYDDGYPRKTVIEEGTGAWCQYCPSGIVMMEFLKENYPDLIRIAVHNGDRMALSNYQGFISTYTPGLPAAIANRAVDFAPQYMLGDDNPAYYKQVYDYFNSFPSYADVDFDVSISENLKTITFNTNTKFAIDSEIPHALVCVVVEDGIGPYDQSNGFSGRSYGGLMTPWCNAGGSVSTIYNEVARGVNKWDGDNSPFAQGIKSDVNYWYQIPVKLTVVPKDQIYPVVMVVNTQTGEVIQAKQITVDAIAAVENIESVEDAGVVEYYTLDGCKVSGENLASGIYIKKSNGSTTKILVK